MNFIKEENNFINNKTKIDKQVQLKNWYAIYTNPRAEKKVFERFIEGGIEAFLPLETVYRKWSDRKKKIKVPYIKSYVFVRVDPKEIYTKVLKVYGTVTVLKYLGKPAIVRDYEIKNLRILSENEAKSIELTSDISIEVGENVEIDKGVFMGLRGKCVRVNGRKSIMIESELLGIVSVVEIAAKYLNC